MKKMLLMLIISISILAYRSPDLLAMLGVLGDAPTASANAATKPAVKPENVTADSLTSKVRPKNAMTIAQYAELAKKDPNAYKKLMESNTIQAPRTEGDKLMNFFAHGKYE